MRSTRQHFVPLRETTLCANLRRKRQKVAAKRYLTTAFTFAAPTLIILCVLTAVLDRTTILEPFDVPQGFEEQGLKGEVLARRVADELERVNSSVPASVAGRRILIPSEATEVPKVEVPGVHLEAGDVVRFLRQALKIQGRKINVDLVRSGSELHGRVHVVGHEIDATEVTIQNSSLESISESITQAILRVENPLAAAAYALNKSDFSNALLYAHEAVERSRADLLPASYNLYGLAVANLNLPEFEDLFRKSIALRPTPEAEVNWANALISKGHDAEAIAHLRQALQLDKTNYVAKVELGRLSPPSIGLKYFREAIRSNPKEGFAFCALAEALSEANVKSVESDDAYRTCVQRYPQYVSAVDQAVHQNLQILRTPDSSREVMLGNEISSLRRMIDHGRDDANVYFELGLLEVNLKQLDGADQDFQKAVVRAPADFRPYEQVAVLRGYRCTHEPNLIFCDSALPWFARAAELTLMTGGKDHMSSYAYQRWGYALLEEHEFDQAAEKFSVAAKQQPRDLLLLYLRATAEELAGHYEEALSLLQQVTHLAFGEPKALAYYSIGNYELDQGNRVAAKDAFKQMANADPKYNVKFFGAKYGSADQAWRTIVKDEQLVAF